MQTLTDLDLPFLDVETPAFAADPFSRFAQARALHPWIARSNIGYFIHDYAAIRELLAQDDKLRPAYDGVVQQLGAQGTAWGQFTAVDSIVTLPNDKHRRLRDAFAAKFTPRFANQLRPMMRATITRLLDEWTPKGRFDFEEFASYFPISNMFTLIGAPLSEVPNIRSSLEALGLAFSMDKNRVGAIYEGFDRVNELVERLIAERRADPDKDSREDLLSLMMDSQLENDVGSRELTDLLIFFFIAGYDTSKNVLTYAMWLMLDRPEIYERCGRDHAYCGTVLEETLRIFNPGSIARFTRDDLVFRDVLIPKDTMLWMALNMSGHDPRVFKDPDVFNPEQRNEANHLAFSLGQHMCLGQFIARAQLQEALHQIPQRICNPRLVGDIGWRPFPGAWGLKGLPIAFEPAEVPLNA